MSRAKKLMAGAAVWALAPVWGRCAGEAPSFDNATAENAMMFMVLVIVIMFAAVADVATRRHKNVNGGRREE